MKRKIAVIVGIIIGLIVLWRVSFWAINGGWPSSGPTNDALPPHIQYVMPSDGEKVESALGFCVHFYYPAGNGMDDESRKGVKYFFNGLNVTKRVIDIVTLEYGYPDPVGEPCYKRSEPLRPGWHTVKVRYVDNVGETFEYIWRFQILGDQ